MNILIGSSEVQPYSKTGGLADMTSALAKYLGAAGAKVGLVTPLYRGVAEQYPEIQRTDRTVEVVLGSRREVAEIWEYQPSENLTVYFVDHVHYFQRAGIYGENNQDYPDNAERFLFLSKVLLKLTFDLPWRPDLVHVHDWQVAMYPLLLHQAVFEGRVEAPPKTLCTIHNLAYQGVFPAHDWPLTNLDGRFFSPNAAEFFGQMNFLKAGIIFADHVSTVSPSYAEEILTPEFGCGLEGVLGDRKSELTGILNGVDYAEWNTTSNPHLTFPYEPNRMVGKGLEKKRLQQTLGLKVESKVPLFGVISRVVEQKGVEPLVKALRQALNHSMQFVMLGSGDPELELKLQELEQQFPDRVRIRIGYNPELSHRIEAGCDFFLMPSRFEPCGLNQLYSLRYGTIPIVNAAGGLRDSVVDESEDAEQATGIKMNDFSSAAVLEGIYRGMRIFRKPSLLKRYREQGMAADFSWERTATAYLTLYQAIVD